MKRPPRIIGHRGVRRDGIDENTMPAFEEAHAQGAAAIELDVRVCATGELVVAHDETLDRVTGGADLRPIADVSLHELRRVPLACGGTIPSLAEVLAFARDRGLGVNVEMKRDVPSRLAVVRATARLLSTWDRAHWLIVSSFDPPMLAAFRLLAPRVPRAVLVHRTGYHLIHAAMAAPVGATAVHLERTLTRPSLVEAIKRRGLAVNVWTVNHAVEARDLAELGVDGLITDRPGELREALGA